MRVIGFFTLGTSYEQDAQLLRASLDRVGMAYHIEGVEDEGDWYANTRRKANFIQDAREAFSGPLVYIDADAIVHQDCAAYFDGLARKGYDYAAHWFHGPSKGHDRQRVRDTGWWMLSGTLFWGDTEGARRLLANWVALNEFWRERGYGDGGGQKNLWQCVTRMKDLSVARIPGRYCYVFDKPWAYPDDEPIIIEHTIASRENRGPSAGTVHEARQDRIRQLREGLGA